MKLNVTCEPGAIDLVLEATLKEGRVWGGFGQTESGTMKALVKSRSWLAYGNTVSTAPAKGEAFQRSINDQVLYRDSVSPMPDSIDAALGVIAPYSMPLTKAMLETSTRVWRAKYEVAS